MKNLLKTLALGGILILNSCNASFEEPKIENTSYGGFEVELQKRTKRITMTVKDPLTGHKLWAEDSDNNGKLDSYSFSPLGKNSIRDSLNKYNHAPQRIYEWSTCEERF